jgi:hypothetical protein
MVGRRKGQWRVEAGGGQVNVNMNETLEDSLKHLELKDGVEGVQELKAPWDDISEVLSDPLRKHLHIVVEHPPAGEFQWIAAAVAILISSSIDSPVLSLVLHLSFTAQRHPSRALTSQRPLPLVLIVRCWHEDAEVSVGHSLLASTSHGCCDPSLPVPTPHNPVRPHSTRPDPPPPVSTPHLPPRVPTLASSSHHLL